MRLPRVLCSLVLTTGSRKSCFDSSILRSKFLPTLNSSARCFYSNHVSHQDQKQIMSPILNQKTSSIVYSNLVIQKRLKKTRPKGKGASTEEEEEDEEEDEDEDLDENPLLVDENADSTPDGSQTLDIDVMSLRLDAVCKTAFAMTRQKIEAAIYKGDIYVNGERPPKKSYDVQRDDELDFVIRKDLDDITKLRVKRVQILKFPDKATEQGRMKIKIRRWQELTIDSYDQNKEDD